MIIVLEKIDGTLAGRIYKGKTKTTAYIIPLKENQYLFTKEQQTLIDNQIF